MCILYDSGGSINRNRESEESSFFWELELRELHLDCRFLKRFFHFPNIKKKLQQGRKLTLYISATFQVIKTFDKCK